jgi:malonyl-CoA O-methyltransferase
MRAYIKTHKINHSCNASNTDVENVQQLQTPRIDKLAVSARFGASSGSYEHVTPVQEVMGLRLLMQIQQMVPDKNILRILELGCGTGRLTRRLAEIYPWAVIVAVDISPEMIAHAKEQYPHAHYVVADAEHFVFEENQEFDLIVSNATIQWFERLEATLIRTKSLLATDGLLAIATFCERTFIELATAFDQAYDLNNMPRRSLVVTMPSVSDLKSILPNAKLIEDDFHSVFKDVRAFMKSIKDAGAVNSLSDRQAIPRAILSSMMGIYNNTYRQQEGGDVLATYHSCYLLDKCSGPLKGNGDAV